MSEEEYDLLCAINDSILLEKKECKYRQAISALHVVREHPVFIKKYTPVLHYNRLEFFAHLIKILIISTIKGAIKSFKTFKYTFTRVPKHTQKTHTEGLIISHFLNHSFLSHTDDFYFSDLSNKLSTDKGKFNLYYINHSALSEKYINQQFQKNKRDKFAFSRYLSLGEELKISLGLISEGLQLWLGSFQYNGIEKRLRKFAALDALSTASHFSLRMESHVIKLIKELQPKFLLSTYEGHAWERILFHGAKKTSKHIVTIGYQHALIFKKQHAIKRRLSENFNPDYVFTSGNYGREVLIRNNFLNPEKIQVFGSSRCKSKEEDLKIFQPNLETVLLLPEGDYNECKLMIDLGVKLASQHPNFKFIVRFHPLIDIKKINQRNKVLNQKPKNIVLSNSSLDEDLSHSNYVIFRGTTAAMKAIQSGLYPIYFRHRNELSINPFGENEKYIDFIDNHFDFKEIILKTNDEKRGRLSFIQSLIGEYFSPINYDVAIDIKLST